MNTQSVCPFCGYDQVVPCLTEFTSEDIPTKYEQQMCLRCGSRGPRTDLNNPENKTSSELWAMRA